MTESYPSPRLNPFDSNCIDITDQTLSIDGSAQARLSFTNCSSSLSYLGTFLVSPHATNVKLYHADIIEIVLMIRDSKKKHEWKHGLIVELLKGKDKVVKN